MKIRCVWEHNGDDSILYADNFVGAYTRGEWKGEAVTDSLETIIVQEKASVLMISDADSDVLFEEEKSLCPD